MSDVAIIMGSDSDWPIMEAAANALDEFGITYTAEVLSAHRMPIIVTGKLGVITLYQTVLGSAPEEPRVAIGSPNSLNALVS